MFVRYDDVLRELALKNIDRVAHLRFPVPDTKITTIDRALKLELCQIGLRLGQGRSKVIDRTPFPQVQVGFDVVCQYHARPIVLDCFLDVKECIFWIAQLLNYQNVMAPRYLRHKFWRNWLRFRHSVWAIQAVQLRNRLFRNWGSKLLPQFRNLRPKGGNGSQKGSQRGSQKESFGSQKGSHLGQVNLVFNVLLN